MDKYFDMDDFDKAFKAVLPGQDLEQYKSSSCNRIEIYSLIRTMNSFETKDALANHFKQKYLQIKDDGQTIAQREQGALNHIDFLESEYEKHLYDDTKWDAYCNSLHYSYINAQNNVMQARNESDRRSVILTNLVVGIQMYEDRYHEEILIEKR